MSSSPQLLQDFIDLAKEVKELSENARCANMHNHVRNALDSRKKILERNVELRIDPSQSCFTWLYDRGLWQVSSAENSAEAPIRIATASPEGFCLSEVTENDVILEVSHFKTQAKVEDGIPQRVIAKALPVITPYLRARSYKQVAQLRGWGKSF